MDNGLNVIVGNNLYVGYLGWLSNFVNQDVRNGAVPTFNAVDLAAGGSDAVIRSIGQDMIGLYPGWGSSTNEIIIAGYNYYNRSGSTVQSVGFGSSGSEKALLDLGSGNLWIAGSYSNSSDRRLKDIDGSFDRGLDAVMKLRPVYYHYKKDNPLDLPAATQHVGFVAQEVQELIPEAIGSDKQGYLTLDALPINVTMVNAVKELNRKVDEQTLGADQAVAALKEENARLKSEVTSQRQAIGALKAYVCGKDPAAAVCH